MHRAELTEKIKARLGDSVISVTDMPNDDLMVVIKSTDVLTTVERLKSDPELRFDFLMSHHGVHYDDSFAVIYNLFSFKNGNKVTLKALLNKENPAVDSIEAIFKGANWFERETYDMLGIQFNRHSDMRRILLPEDWVGHPLRKDYVFPDEYGGMDNLRPSLIEEKEDSAA